MSYSNALNKGQVLFDDYEIVRVLGEGGFGITYLAYQTKLKKAVAIKEYFPVEWAVRTRDMRVECMMEKKQELFHWGLDSFLQEAQTIAKFQHANIVRPIDYKSANGTAYLIMEYVEGKTLEQIIKERETLPAEDVRFLMEKLLSGLDHAHELSVLHRDIKPANIVIRASDGEPVLIDFGAARETVQKRSAPITAIVTAPYAPHEQYSTQMQKQGAWTDLYAVSTVGFECLTGKRPPDGPGRVEEDTHNYLDEQQHNDSDLCRAINQGMHVRTVDRPTDVETWLAYSGTKFIHLKPGIVSGDNGKKDDSNSPPDTKKRGKDSGGFRTVPRPPTPLGGDRQGQSPQRRSIPVIIGGVIAAIVFGFYYVSNLDGTDLDPDRGSVDRRAANYPPSGLDRWRDSADIEALENDIPMLVRIPAGSFEIGSTPDELGRDDDESPKTRITIDYEYALSETEITVGQWQACTANGLCEKIGNLRIPATNELVNDPSKPNDPVRGIRPTDIQDYLQFLTERTGHTYRLPTEAEWTYAAQAGTDNIYPWGNDARPDLANCKDCIPGRTHASLMRVGSFPANAFGLHDMQGNVWEITADCWTRNFSSIPTTGAATRIEDCHTHPVKGGAYSSGIAQLRVAARQKFQFVENGEEKGSFIIGFRVLREIHA